MKFFIEYAKSIYHCIMSAVQPLVLSDEKAVLRYYAKRSGGRKADLQAPQLFSEKLQWYKLNARDPLMARCADKVEVRGYVAECGHADLLNELYGVYDRVRDIPLRELPERFVLKAAHGSGWNIIVKDKDRVNWRQARLMMASWLHQSLYWSGREWVYKDQRKRIIAEKYLEDETGGLRDYKFYCFNGEPVYMQLEVGRYTDHNTRNFYDMDWNLMPFGKELPHDPNAVIPRPAGFDEMKAIARDLCRPFQFVRVDLYQVGGKVLFGEMTFFPAGGAPDFVPAEYDAVVGRKWTLVK